VHEHRGHPGLRIPVELVEVRAGIGHPARLGRRGPLELHLEPRGVAAGLGEPCTKLRDDVLDEIAVRVRRDPRRVLPLVLLPVLGIGGGGFGDDRGAVIRGLLDVADDVVPTRAKAPGGRSRAGPARCSPGG
jgi:hypothetical protein